MDTYTVRRGESLTAIARRHGVPLHLLIQVNGITDPNRIKVGQVLEIPAMTTDASDHPLPEEPAPRPETAAVAINRTTFQLPPSQYVGEETPKDLVVLHFTAGTSARSALQTWMANDARIATAYVLDVDGTVYELFDPRFWAFHLGIKGAANANFRHDRRSVGIEIANAGPLKLSGDRLCWWPGEYTTECCKVADRERYVKASFRGFDHYVAYTEAQYGALGPLVAHLCERFSIPRRLPSIAKRTQADVTDYFKDFSGIASHQNFRSDKFDVGPAFDWQRLSI